MPFSRRQFLQLTGIALLGPAVGLPEMPSLSVTYGRALVAAPIRPQPLPAAATLRHLWPDTVLPITPRSGGWYQTSDGYVEKAHIQPLLTDATYSVPASQPPFWAEVSAPIATIRAWCAADAPLITRVGHGGVMHIIDQLPGDPLWYGVADEHGNLLGWTTASGWQPVHVRQPRTPLTLYIDQRRQQMRVTSNHLPVLQAAISTGSTLPSGTYTLTRRDMPGIRHADYYGAAWPQQFGAAGTITGVYWHNQFGAEKPGPAVQVPTYLARWLYHTCADGSLMSIF